MFCPICSSYVTENSLHKSKSKYSHDGKALIEYEATCPRCNNYIGKISWGQFVLAPGLEQIANAHTGSPDAEGMIATPATYVEPTSRGKIRRKDTAEEETAHEQKSRCPHCGVMVYAEDEENL